MKKRGIGIGVSFYGTGYGNGFPDISRAIIRLLPGGKIGVYCGVTEVGQGAKTAMRQIGAEVLGLNIEDIELVHENTSLMPDSGTAAATRQTYNTGNAIKIACENMKNELFDKAKIELNLNSTAGLILKDGEIVLSFFPQKRISYAKLAEIYNGDNTIEAKGEFTAQTTEMDPETGQGAPYWPYTFNACAVEVEVDTETGIINLIRSTFAQDAGRAVNPKILEGQMDGGFAMGLGYTLLEDLNLENGIMKNNKFSKYLIPTAMDMIDINNIIVEDPETTAPYGAKGIGEPVMIPMAPAILNAIYDATGVRITEMPVTPERFIRALKEAEDKK
ncbi:purine hydroxylase beta subunit apoprotein [Tissierella praeacuta DSM 18095]|uniref:Purine hydroxylase beta subunit apoprotein n=1 Tax=Tissierella praeacuta DSM 18095 TaxID=1123404 RepID=A0A1M4UIQ1_9FIRM|nr:molybdopterin cofactor-binding domain-containing protein [Tissierella praeacuta]TCU68974.1 purine hydroxylase beta subunit apoprotein [Tissierella praeacuta]SHE56577.1 purine hydroxylase beta subunit apoprotein [Tissierella praeacuta DSM 18095]SUP03681.1 Nicotinate dehydrogenase medium molybdopterin subunit [Tissierella praeacuta]